MRVLRTIAAVVRTPVLLAALSLVAACGGSSSSGAQPPTTALATTEYPRTTSTTEPAPPAPVAWAPTPNEPAPDVKVGAVRPLEAALTYALGEGTVDAASARVAALGLPRQLAVDLEPLLVADGASTARVVYPQLAGLTDTAASVMVVTEITVEDGDELLTTTRTIDVRLEATPSGWRATTVASLGSAPETTAGPPPDIADLLDADSIDLPDSAIWDLQAGSIDRRVVELLLALGADHDLGVAVMASGHPINVFDRGVTSNHTLGRGVDIWEVDGTPVAEQQESPTLRAIVDRAIALGATEIGAPFDIDGPGGKVFTNTVHKDHLHLAFDPPPPTTSTAPSAGP